MLSHQVVSTLQGSVSAAQQALDSRLPGSCCLLPALSQRSTIVLSLLSGRYAAGASVCCPKSFGQWASWLLPCIATLKSGGWLCSHMEGVALSAPLSGNWGAKCDWAFDGFSR